MPKDTNQTERKQVGDFGRVEWKMVNGERPYLWLAIDGVCVDTFEGKNLRALKRALA